MMMTLKERVVEAAARAAFIRDDAELRLQSSLESKRVEARCRQVIYDCRCARDLLASKYERSAECFVKRAESELEVAADALKELQRSSGKVPKGVVPVPSVVVRWAHAHLKRAEKHAETGLEIAAEVLGEAKVEK